MSRPEPAIVAIVLAGGRSSRFGSDKLAAVVDGEPLLHRALRGAAGLPASDDIVLVIATDAAVPPLPSGLGACVRVVRDPEAFGGPLVGLRAGLEGLADDAIAVVVAGDMPMLRAPVLRLLVHALAADPMPDAALLEHDGPAPLPMTVRARPAREASDVALANGRRSLRALLDTLQVTRVPAAAWRALDPDAETLRDIDTPGDAR
jgi:molybdopterin-guanine dinucleotide biosynthesis protein A